MVLEGSEKEVEKRGPPIECRSQSEWGVPIESYSRSRERCRGLGLGRGLGIELGSNLEPQDSEAQD